MSDAFRNTAAVIDKEFFDCLRSLSYIGHLCEIDSARVMVLRLLKSGTLGGTVLLGGLSSK